MKCNTHKCEREAISTLVKCHEHVTTDVVGLLVQYAERLRTRLAELEAAVCDYAVAVDGQYSDPDSHTCEDGDAASHHCLACHELRRFYRSELASRRKLLVLGRSIAKRMGR